MSPHRLDRQCPYHRMREWQPGCLALCPRLHLSQMASSTLCLLSSFDFAVSNLPLDMGHGRPDHLYNGMTEGSNVVAPMTSPSDIMSAFQSSAPSEANEQQNNAAELEAIMRMFYGSDVAPGQIQQPTLTHINPNQVFSQMGSLDSIPIMAHTMLNSLGGSTADDTSSPAWSYSPASTNNHSPAATPPQSNAANNSYQSSPLAAHFPTTIDTSKGKNGKKDSRPSSSGASVKGDGRKGSMGATAGSNAKKAADASNGGSKSDHASMATADPPTICSNCKHDKDAALEERSRRSTFVQCLRSLFEVARRRSSSFTSRLMSSRREIEQELEVELVLPLLKTVQQRVVIVQDLLLWLHLLPPLNNRSQQAPANSTTAAAAVAAAPPSCQQFIPALDIKHDSHRSCYHCCRT